MFNTKVEITTTELNKWRLHHKRTLKLESKRKRRAGREGQDKQDKQEKQDKQDRPISKVTPIRIPLPKIRQRATPVVPVPAKVEEMENDSATSDSD